MSDGEDAVNFEWKDARSHREPKWPLMGYTPGGYTFSCLECEGVFIGGDKRATNCLPCAIDRANLRARQVVEELRAARSHLETLKSAIKIIRDVEA